jgi:hypothetical protein
MEDSSSAFAPALLKSWSQRKDLLPGLALVALAAAGGSMSSSSRVPGSELRPRLRRPRSPFPDIVGLEGAKGFALT